MPEKKKKAFTIKEIELKKAQIRHRCQQIEQEIIGEVFNPTTILTGIATGLAAKYLLPSGSDEAHSKNTFLYKKVISKDKSGILPALYNVAKHPVVSRLFTRTRKSWIQWQLFNIGVFLVKKGMEYYRNKRYEEAEVTASEPLKQK